MRKYTFHVQRAKGSSRSYTKAENMLDDREINLLLGNLVNEFQKSPDKVKEKFIDHMFYYIMQSQNGTSTQHLDNSIIDSSESMDTDNK